jgi:hypothetical protein
MSLCWPRIRRHCASGCARAKPHSAVEVRGSAAAAFEKATKLDAANGDAWSGLAFAASKLHQPSVTIHALTMRSKYMPECPQPIFLGHILRLNDKVAAATYYHHFLESSAGKFRSGVAARQRLPDIREEEIEIPLERKIVAIF